MTLFEDKVGFRQPLYISDGANINLRADLINDWAMSCIYLGWWAKSQHQKNNRRITIMVLPSREPTTALVALGALAWSVGSYKDGLSWEKFSTLDSGVEIFWKKIESGDLYIGRVIGVESFANEPAIKLEITKSRKGRDVGSLIIIPEGQFNKFQFSLERPASAQREVLINASISFFERLIGNISPSWAQSDGQDLLLVSKMNQFRSSIEHLLMGVGVSDALTELELEFLLGFEQLGDGRHSKMKITHPKGDLASNAGLVILDGPSAFSIREHVSPQNDLLIILDSLEFNEHELDFVKELEFALGSDDSLIEHSISSERFPVGFEVSSYSFPR